MSALHAAPAGFFDLQRPGAWRPPHPPTRPNHAGADGVITGSDASAAQGPDQDGQEEGLGDEDIDESVKEDMQKLEDTFPGISDRFRLVNRIGEGIVGALVLFSSIQVTD